MPDENQINPTGNAPSMPGVAVPASLPMPGEGLPEPEEPQLPVAETEEEQDEMSQTVDADFTEDEEDEVIRICQTELSRIKQEYDEINWFEKCETADDEYEGAHSFEDPDDTNPDIKLLLTTLTIDIIASRAFRQTWTPNPLIMMEAEFQDDKKADILSLRSDNLDYYLRNKAKLQEISLPLYRAAGKYGSAVLKPFYAVEQETQTFRKYYRPHPDDLAKFEKKYAKKLMKGKGKEFEEWQTLKQRMMTGDNKPVSKIETEDIVLYKGARMYRVDWKKFFARPKIKDFRKHTVISELFTYNWYEIEQNVRSKFWNEERAEEIKNEYGDNYLKTDFDFYTSIVQFDRKQEGKLQRYLVTYEAKSKKIVRAKYYPYKHIFYFPYSVFDRDDSWIGYSITERMSDIAATANSFINSGVKEQDLAHTPLIVSTGTKVGDWNIVLGKPNLLPLNPQGMGQATTFMQYKLETVSTDRLAWLNWILNFVSILTGVDPMLLSGAQDPTDKRAPAARTQMKLQASTIRIEDMIMTLQKSDAAVAEHIEDIIYRFKDDSESDDYKFFRNGKEQTIKYEDMTKPVRYIVAGSRMAFDRNQDLQVIMQQIDFVAKFFPEVWANLEAKKAFYEADLNNCQGTIEKMKDTFLKPLDDMIDASKKQQEQLGAFIDQKKAQGATDQQIQQFLASMQKPAMPPGGAPRQNSPAAPQRPQGPPPQAQPPQPARTV